jgi:Tfp pilus assembly protein PilX
MREIKNISDSTNREGFAMVTTLLLVLVLSVMAVGVVWIATAEKKTVFAESVHVRSLFSADAGGEAAINRIRLANAPPLPVDFVSNRVATVGETQISGSQTYDYDCIFERRTARMGWSTKGYVDYDYRVLSHGTASTQGESGIQLAISRLFKEGY